MRFSAAFRVLLTSHSRLARRLAELATRRPLGSLCLLVIVVGSIVYGKFLIFENLFIYYDIGLDGLDQTWPLLVARARGISTWTFQSGLGQEIFSALPHDPLVTLATLLGEHRVVFALPYIMLARSTMAGALAYLYLTAVGVSSYAAFVGAVGYAFCGLLILLGGWSVPFASATVVAMLLLYSVELFRRDKPLLVPIASATIVFSGAFHLFFFGLMTFTYVLFRIRLETRATWRATRSAMLRFAGYFALGVGITSWLSIPELVSMVASPRATTGEGSLFRTLSTQVPWKPVAGEELTSAILRLFGNDLTGPGSLYSGWNNAMESPAFYCGLALLVALPQVFPLVDERRRQFYGGLIGLCLAYLLFPFFRRSLSGFMGDYYRNTALLVTLVVLFLGAQALSRIEEQGRINRPLLWTTTTCLSLLLLFAYALQWRRAPTGTFPVDGGLLVALTVLLVILHAVVLQGLAGDTTGRLKTRAVLVLLTAVEVCGVSFVTVNKRLVMPAAYVNSGTEYYDGTAAAVSALRESDSTFFRVEKIGYSVFLNDALFQGYNGTRAYRSFNHPSYVAFLRAMDVPFYLPGQTAYIDGFRDRYLLNTLVSIKYLLTSREMSLPGYKLGTRRGYAIYENLNFLPFGFTYEIMIPEDQFSTLSPGCRDVALLTGFVPSSEARPRLEQYKFRPLPGDASCEDFTEERYAGLVRSLSADHLQIEEFDQTSFRGSIVVSRDKMLFFSIPFDRGWSLRINGRPAPLERVNIGFSGVPLHPGTYLIDLRYRLPGLEQGVLVSVLSLLGFLALLARSCHPQRPAMRSGDGEH